MGCADGHPFASGISESFYPQEVRVIFYHGKFKEIDLTEIIRSDNLDVKNIRPKIQKKGIIHPKISLVYQIKKEDDEMVYSFIREATQKLGKLSLRGENIRYDIFLPGRGYFTRGIIKLD